MCTQGIALSTVVHHVGPIGPFSNRLIPEICPDSDPTISISTTSAINGRVLGSALALKLRLKHMSG